LGYLPYAYYESNKKRLKAVAVDNGKKAVLPSMESIQGGSYSPLSRPIFIYVSEQALTRPEVREFAEFYLKSVGELAAQVKYVALPKKAYDLALERLKKEQMGTVFGGESQAGVKIEELLKKEAKL